LFPGHPFARNNLVWLISTRVFAERAQWKGEAQVNADELLKLSRLPNYLDTVACFRAWTGDFKAAAALEMEALLVKPNDSDYFTRLQQFSSEPPQTARVPNKASLSHQSLTSAHRGRTSVSSRRSCKAMSEQAHGRPIAVREALNRERNAARGMIYRDAQAGVPVKSATLASFPAGRDSGGSEDRLRRAVP
jgi:hypothetical protein